MDFRLYIFNVQQLLLLSIFPCCCFCRDFINHDAPLKDGETLVSAGEGKFELGFFTPNGSLSGRYVGIWYRSSNQTVVWVANRDKPVPSSGHGVFGIFDRNLHVRDEDESLWSSGIETSQHDLTAHLMDSGNLVLGKSLWESFENPSDTFLPGMKMQAGINLTSWKAKDDPSLGRFIFKLDDQQRYVIMNKSVTYWKHGGKRALPNILTERPVSNSTYKSLVMGRDTDTRLVMNFDGTLEYQNTSMGFVPMWFEPADRCSIIDACGVYGVCNAQGTPMCKCLPGFTPVYSDFSGGCKQKSTECGNTFQNLTSMYVRNPESEESQISNETECMESCRENCKCNAYSFRAGRYRRPTTCLIWTEPLYDLQQDFIGGTTLSVRLAAEDQVEGNPPLEPICTSDSDCDELSNTSCGPAKGNGGNRCLCKTGYKWNSLKSVCVHSQGSSFPHVIVLASVSALALLCASTWLIIWKRKRLRKRGKKRSEQRSKELLKLDTQERLKHCMNSGEFKEEDGKGVDVPFFNFDTIITATDGFSDYNKLGQGGYGPVYKGTFQGGQEIAVKRLSSFSVQGLEEFKNEVIVIAKLQHRNLVRLQGYCIKGSEKILLYEYMPNRSLDSFIFDGEQRKMLDWEKRFNITVGIARGLLYLHQDSRLRIIHRDLKTSNILLDQEMEPKISDFGLARIFGSKQTEANTERVVGTYGYMSPEYAIEGLFSVKSDVYSFGVVLLEIISGKRNTRLAQLSGRPISLLGYAWQLWTENKVLELVDPAMTESCNGEQFMKCVKIALICVQEDPSERPTMSTVVTMLDSNSANVPDPLHPAFVLKTGTTIPSSSSADTRAEITVTLEHGR